MHTVWSFEKVLITVGLDRLLVVNISQCSERFSLTDPLHRPPAHLNLLRAPLPVTAELLWKQKEFCHVEASVVWTACGDVQAPLLCPEGKHELMTVRKEQRRSFLKQQRVRE